MYRGWTQTDYQNKLFFNDPATNETYTTVYTLALPDALPIFKEQETHLTLQEHDDDDDDADLRSNSGFCHTQD
jgi:hypothetical protein